MSRTFAWHLTADLYGVPVLVAPGDSRFEVVSPEDIEAAGDSPRAFVDRAISNTRALLQPEDQVCVHFEAGSIGKINGGTPFESSRLANHRWWEKAAAKVRGSLLVAAPDWRVLLYADSANEGANEVLASVAARIASARNPTSLSSTILRWQPDGWEPT
ncbi:MAG: DUF1444 domain-containing protein [Myxococcaceae bacterium]|nr:DUF1444 domain-containing protein [Myxococcaceae bacterium]